MVEQCVFCEEYGQGRNTLAETDLWRARWDLYPATPGHVEILPKRHVQYLEQLSDDELNAMMWFARYVMGQVRATNLIGLYTALLPESTEKNQPLLSSALLAAQYPGRQPDAFNFGLNDGPIAGQSVHHLHLHLMPRWEGDVADPKGGVRNLFPNDTYGRIR